MRAGIAGAGLLGRLLAYRLLEAGWSVTLFDKDSAGGEANCGMAAAGMLTPFSEMEKNPALIFQLGTESLRDHWPRLMAALDAALYFKSSGSLVLAHPRDRVELERFLAMVQLNLVDLEECGVNQAQITALEPQLSKFDRGVFFPMEAHFDNQAWMQALAQHLKDRGVDWRGNALVTALKPGVIDCDGNVERFDMVFDCRGLGAKAHFKNLRSVRGELIWVHAPEVQLQRPVRLLNPRYSLYIVPRPNHTFILGATEIESEDESPISVRTTLELLSAACSVNSAFDEARIIKTVVGCRPTLLDHLPKIKYQSGLCAINGLYRHGFLIAPALVEEVMGGLNLKQRYPEMWGKFYD